MTVQLSVEPSDMMTSLCDHFLKVSNYVLGILIKVDLTIAINPATMKTTLSAQCQRHITSLTTLILLNLSKVEDLWGGQYIRK